MRSEPASAPWNDACRLSEPEILASIRAVAGLALLDIGPRVDVDTSQAWNLDAVLRDVRKALGRRAMQSLVPPGRT